MILRSLLLVTPDNDQSFDRALASVADALIVDVAAMGEEALRRTAAFLAGARRETVFVRVGPLAVAHTVAALDALVPARPAGVALAGAEGGADVTRLAALLRPREAMAGIDDGATRIIALATETPAALLALGTYARVGTLIAAAAAGVAALDRPFCGDDTAALRAEAEAARRAGFSGKLALVADHVAVINAAFSAPAGSSS